MPKYLGQPLTGPSLVGLSVSSGLHCCQHLPPPGRSEKKKRNFIFLSHNVAVEPLVKLTVKLQLNQSLGKLWPGGL